MQFASLNLVLGLLIAMGLVIAFGFVVGAPILAIPIFLVVFGGFLVWRGTHRQERGGRRRAAKTPSTAEAAADPVRDSSLPDVR